MTRHVGSAVVAVLAVCGAAVAFSQPEAPTCAPADIAVSFGRVEGAGSTVHREVLFTNRGVYNCVLAGYPGVSYVDANGAQVGSDAVRVGSAGPPLTLRIGTAVGADVGFARVDDLTPDLCGKTPVRGVRVYPPDAREPLNLPLPGQYGCTRGVAAQLTVAAVHSTS